MVMIILWWKLILKNDECPICLDARTTINDDGEVVYVVNPICASQIYYLFIEDNDVPLFCDLGDYIDEVEDISRYYFKHHVHYIHYDIKNKIKDGTVYEERLGCSVYYCYYCGKQHMVQRFTKEREVNEFDFMGFGIVVENDIRHVNAKYDPPSHFTCHCYEDMPYVLTEY